MPPTRPTPRGSKMIHHGPEDDVGQVVITPDGVVHVADADGNLQPPIDRSDGGMAEAMADPALGTSPHGNPYTNPPTPPSGRR